MKYLNLTFPGPDENLACDEALLDAAEEGVLREETLRFWEPKDHFVVLGYSNKIKIEVNEAPAEENKIPIFRRASGGGTVLQGPGCLNYSLILKIDGNDELKNLVKTNHYILNRHRKALESVLNQKVLVEGISDLAIGSKKFSGNAQRRRRKYLLFHGTFLLNMDLDLIEKILPIPSKQPDYRKNRSHKSFIMNLNLKPELITQTLRKIWKADQNLNHPILLKDIEALVRNRYSLLAWNHKF